MSREPKPYYRAVQDRWVCTIDGNRITLGKNKKEAFDKFHKLMTERTNIKANIHTVYGLTQAYLDWVQINRSEGTYDNNKRYLMWFIDSIGRTLKIADLRPHHLSKWIDKTDWSSTSKNDALSIVTRVMNWGIEQGYIQSSPIQRLSKPKRKRREVFYSEEQQKSILSHIKDKAFNDLLSFLWTTGCRPKEARDLEHRHVDLEKELVLLPADEAKGGIPRVIYLTPESKKILEELIKKRPTGKLFLNSRGRPWTKDAIKCRLTRISEKVGFRVFAYAFRHSYCTRGLKKGVDTTVLASLMGHKDSRMVQTTYSHIASDIEFLKAQSAKIQ